MSLYLPSEIWDIIIRFIYPIKQGFHKQFLKLGLVSKTFNHLVKILFKIYQKNPIFNNNPEYINRNILTSYLLKDFTTIEPGFVASKKDNSSILNKFYSDSKYKFIYKNCRTDKNFYYTDYVNERLLVANCITRNRTRKLERITYITEIDETIIIIPFKNNHNNINAAYFIQKFYCYYTNKYITHLEMTSDKEYYGPNYSKIDSMEKNFYQDDEIFFFKLINYVKDLSNPIPNKIIEFVNAIMK